MGTLKITQIEAKKPPQSGDWRAGVAVWQDSEPDTRDSWHGGEDRFSGSNAILPVNLELGGIASGQQVVVWVAIDDDAEDAGTDKAEDQMKIPFKVFASTKEKVYDHGSGDWSLRIHYRGSP